MKVSYNWLQSFFEKKLPKPEKLAEILTLHSFEVENIKKVKNDWILDIDILPNRAHDCLSHYGVAKEISALLNYKLQIPIFRQVLNSKFKASKILDISIKDSKLCCRYVGRIIKGVKVGVSPKWLRERLEIIGKKSINNIVDATNYVMFELGQPTHIFDLDKVENMEIRNPKFKNLNKFKAQNLKIIIRRARKGEKITTLDNENYELDENVLVIADTKEALAIAGIKGGKKAEVNDKTTNIILESANFESFNIRKISRKLNLRTDSSVRFENEISPELTGGAIDRLTSLILEIAGGKAGQKIDTYLKKPSRKIIKFDIERFNKFIGVNFNIKIAKNYFKRLGFKISQQSTVNSQQSFLVEPSKARLDIETFEDLAEEVIRLYGYNKLKPSPPHIHLTPSGFEDEIVLKDKLRKVLTGFGLDEVYNYSFVSRTDIDYTRTNTEDSPYKSVSSQYESALVELENPISMEYKYLRPSLEINLLKNIKNNQRFFDDIKIFEIGKVFAQINAGKNKEKLNLGIAVASKNKEIFFELRGIVEELFKKIGLVDYLMPEIPHRSALEIKSNNEKIGELKKVQTDKFFVALVEIDLEKLLKLIEEEKEYQPLLKYPSIMRDISILVDEETKVGKIMQVIQEFSLKLIDNVDLMDEYDIRKGLAKESLQLDSQKTRSLTFRVVFQSKDRTLTDIEVDKEIEKIKAVVQKKFNAEIR